MIRYRIVASKLSNNPHGFVGRVTSRRTVELEEIAAEIARLGTAVSEPDVLNVLRHYNEVIARILGKGETVVTPAVHYRVTMRGTFRSGADSFDPSRHRLVVQLTPGRLLRKAVRDVQVEKYVGAVPTPQPTCYTDTHTGVQNGVVTPQAEGLLVGGNLRFDPADPRQGIFFLDEAGGATRVANVGLNRPRQLVFIVPDLPAGRYRLEVRALFRNNGDAEVRAGRLGATLMVN